ncbi:MAG: DEAD/DEAH box helicase, partial [Thermoplasmata archaeon]
MSERRSPFRRVQTERSTPEDIESLFKELKNRAPHVRDLFAHQADILREYSEMHADSPDVSLELPTGSGKTLVGLLIGEYRRRRFDERILYLCPTRQLAHQVGQQSIEYGIDARVFVGPKRNYPPEDVASYRSAKAVAVSTYSSLFNVNPGLNDPQTIVLDDAHSAETYIASMWSIIINRSDRPDLYSKILSVFEEDLPRHFVASLQQPTRPRFPVKPEKVPFGGFQRKVDLLHGLLEASIPSPEVPDLFFSWTAIRDGLHACHVYFSWDEILIRPYIPPTLTHAPFSRANQRVYMSASLGRGGELERATGIGSIARIRTPKTYAQHGVGRRLFILPDLVADPRDYESWVGEKLVAEPRTLVLCPNWVYVEALQGILDHCEPRPAILGAKEIEESIDPFINSDGTILLLTNRYDGLDLPHDACHQLLIYGLPSRTNLQETFLEQKLGLEVLLRERFKTRITQATGRCTRSDTDFSVVLMLGRALLDFCARTENQRIFHPELRAEIRFALGQNPANLGSLDAMLNSFSNRDENWEAAEQNIAELRASELQPDSATTDRLAAVVQGEVDFSYALWNGNSEKAVRYGTDVVDRLSGSRVAPYRAFWCYLTASAAYALGHARKEYLSKAEDYLNRATE